MDAGDTAVAERDYALRTHNLTKRYGHLVAVNSVTLRVAGGEMYGFLGANGAGKTTTIMMVLGAVRPTVGDIWLFGRRLSTDYYGIKRRVGVVPEHQYLYDDIPAIEYLQLFAALYKVPSAQKRIAYLLNRLDLGAAGHQRLREYSRGMRQKLSLARALLHDPELLFLDEPVSGLDPHGIKQVRDLLLEEKARGKTIVISSHVLSEVEQTCQRMGIMSHGSLVAQGTMAELRSHLADNTCIEVECGRVTEQLLAVLRALPYVQHVQQQELVLSIFTRTDQDYRAALSHTLWTHGAQPVTIRLREASLEDIFVSLTA